uniref:Uncharacterized protein n=1 Tax=Leviviridae sp. TaxID=2027243 RepID=A0A514D1I8_9VIRU|nr:MAG: hypothetical protein H1Rhizo27417e2655_000002 [Leviviridae sp.]
MSRKQGLAVRAKVRVPTFLPRSEAGTEVLQQELDEAVEEQKDALVFQVYLGRKVAIFLVAMGVQFFYVFRVFISEDSYNLLKAALHSITVP